MDNLMNITRLFGFESYYMSAQRLTLGHINDTYKIIYSGNRQYILQKINGTVFKNPEKIMHNISVLDMAVKAEGKSIIPEYISKDGRNFIIVNGEYWRMCPYIDNTVTFAFPESEELCFGFGEIIGEFHKTALKIDKQQVFETIADFHCTPKIIQKLLDMDKPVMHSQLLSRAAGYSKSLLSDSRRQIVHNDAKCSNILFDKDTLRPAAVVDLDTVMPGLAVYDIADALRSCCSDGAEINTDRFCSFLKGYLSGYGSIDPEGCVYGIICICSELAARYLYDFLSGENYFRFMSDRMKLDRFKALVQLAENTEANAEILILKARSII